MVGQREAGRNRKIRRGAAETLAASEWEEVHDFGTGEGEPNQAIGDNQGAQHAPHDQARTIDSVLRLLRVFRF